MRHALTSVRQLFSFLNDVSFPYVVLRNWERLPDRVEVGAHGDLDLLVYDASHFLELIPGASLEHPAPRVRYKLPVGESVIYLDLRALGDGYYPREFAEKLLREREWHEAGFFTPSPANFRVALAYHAVHHKGANTYPKHLGSATVPELLEALKLSGVGWEQPIDPTVGRYHAYETGATSTVEMGDGRVIKSQRAYLDYDLLANEARCLKEHTSRHFPKVLDVGEADRRARTLELEHCGVALTVETLPADWKAQLTEVLLDLQAHRLEHRDIKPDNLMVKDGVVKLIDFGWARFTDDPEDHAPACLGVPYRASWGPDDLYAMRKVIKEFEYQQEELLESASGEVARR